jgi:quercetin dioxygenase-like cupin family protein
VIEAYRNHRAGGAGLGYNPPMKPWIAVLAPLFGSAILCTGLLAQPVPGEVAITAEPHHHLALENEYVRVFKVEVAPHTATLMHRHDPDYLFVALGAADLENDVAGKPPAPLKLQDGETRFTAGGFAHIAKNLSDQPFRNVTIELLRKEPAGATPPAVEERSHREFSGGSADLLFVKDGARVSDVRLGPGAVIPKHHHNGPHLVVAVTDLELRSEVEGQSPTNRQIKAGDIAWIPGGITHTVTNAGKTPARMITVEFAGPSKP